MSVTTTVMHSLLSILVFGTCVAFTSALSDPDLVVPIAQQIPVDVTTYDVTSKTGAKSILTMEPGNVISAVSCSHL